MKAENFRRMSDEQKQEYYLALAMRDNHAAMMEFNALEKYLDKPVEVVKGRKIPIGTKGICFYAGAVNYNKYPKWWNWTIRLGIMTEKGERFFTAEHNVELS